MDRGKLCPRGGLVALSGGRLQARGKPRRSTPPISASSIATDNIKHGTDFTIEGDGVFGAFAKNDATISTLRRLGGLQEGVLDHRSGHSRYRDRCSSPDNTRTTIGTSLSWGLTQSTAREARPHTSTFQNGQLDFTDPLIAAEAALDPDFVYNPSLGRVSTIQYQTFVNDGIGSLDSSRKPQFIEETATEASLDLQQSIYLTDDKEDGPRIDLSVGASNIDKEREQQGRVYLLRTASWERWVARNPPAWWTSNSGIGALFARIAAERHHSRRWQPAACRVQQPRGISGGQSGGAGGLFQWLRQRKHRPGSRHRHRRHPRQLRPAGRPLLHQRLRP